LNGKRPRLLSWIFLVLATALGGWLVYLLGGLLVSLASSGAPALLWLLAGAYAALAAGFLAAAILTRFAPGRRYPVAVGQVFVMVGVAAALMRGGGGAAGPLPAALLGTSLVVGAFGYALRVRGFSETVSREP
jgi:hypothetical protein